MKQAAQPQGVDTVPEAIREAVLGVVHAHRDQPGALLPVLHGVQRVLGHVPSSAVPVIAHELNLSRADVHGVISFYHFFRTEPGARRTVYLCRAESCQAVGGARLEAHVKQRLGVDFHQNSADGAWRLEPVYCLGNCACSPALMADDELLGRVTPERFDDWLQAQHEDVAGEGAT